MPPSRIPARSVPRSKPRGRFILPVAVTALSLLAVVPPAVASGAPQAGSTAAKSTAAKSAATKSAATTAGKGAAAKTVTLLTGDKVTVTPGGSGPDSISVTSAAGGRASARIVEQDGDVFVYPLAADPYVGAGLLDHDLFNVTQLIADEFDDAHTDGLPLILTYGSSAKAKRSAAAPTPPEGAEDVRALSSINSTALTQDRDEATDFWSSVTESTSTETTGTESTTAAAKSTTAAARSAVTDAAAGADAPALAGGVTKIWLDGKVHADLATSTAQIGAQQVWAGGNTGKGVNVAVLDTGYDTEHPDLAGVVTSSQSFVPDEDIVDHVGHGTHVASTIVGTGAASGGKEVGVAPGASLYVGKVLDNHGSGYDSWIIAGMEWAARDAKAKVISMSLGSDQPDDGTDPMSQAVDELSQETGALFTIAAGNSGPGNHTVASPGAATEALTVGAVDSTDTIADFSSRGPRFRDEATKPEVTAPGVDILAALSQYSDYPPDASGKYTAISGTSMATPHVAGTAALVAAAHPDWKGSQIKDALISSAAQVGTDPDAYGNGRVDALAAAEGTLFATGTVNAGIHPLGGPAGEVVDKTVTYTNTAEAAVTVDLAVDAPGVPAGVFTVADTQLTVPAGGTASTTVSTHIDSAPAGNRFTGKLIATTGGTVRARTLLAVSTKEEPHHLRAKITTTGGYSPSILVNYQRKGDPNLMTAYADPDGQFDVVVENGTYAVWTYAVVKGVHGASSAGLALLSAPEVVVDGDTDITLDAAKAEQIKLTTPKTSTDLDVRLDFNRTYADGSPDATDVAQPGDGFDSMWALPVKKPTDGDVLVTARWRMTQPLVALSYGKQDFDDLWVQPGSTYQAAADRTLPAIFTGAGQTKDYAGIDAKGKISVVRYGDTDKQVRAAEAAGVALLVIVNDVNGRLYEPILRTTGTVVGVSRTPGEALISQIKAAKTASVPMHLVTHPKWEYLYDLTRTWKGDIPSDLSYAPTKHELARVEVDFGNNPAQEVYEGRYDVQPYLDIKIGQSRLSRTGAHRTDWVSASTPWMESAEAGLTSFQYSGVLNYPAGDTTDVRWFGPFDRPRINQSQQLPVRTGDRLVVVAPGWGDATADHAGLIGPGETDQLTSLYQGDKLILENGGYWAEADLPADKARYRLVTTTKRTGFPYSVATSTEWGFSSASAGADKTTQLPLIQVDYGIDIDATGKVDRTAKLLVLPSHIPGISAAEVSIDQVELSYDDGKTWQEGKLSSSARGTRTRLEAPADATFASVRVHASDSEGNTVVQTIERAVGLS